jgi:hypothetical protein
MIRPFGYPPPNYVVFVLREHRSGKVSSKEENGAEIIDLNARMMTSANSRTFRQTSGQKAGIRHGKKKGRRSNGKISVL